MRLALLAALSMTLAAPALADWQDTLDGARGQTVYWNAWGGDGRTNAFIAWVWGRKPSGFMACVSNRPSWPTRPRR